MFFHGDGLAMFYTEDYPSVGPVFGFKDHFRGLGLFFDVYANSKHDHDFPYISMMVGDGGKEFDHHADNEKSMFGTGCQVFA